MRQEFYARAHEAAEEHLGACMEAYFAEDNGDDEIPESPAIAPFCGCDTCQIREVLHAALPIIEEGVREELRGEALDAS